MFINLLAEETATNTTTAIPLGPYIVLLGIIGIAFLGVFIYLIILSIKALRRYLKSSEMRVEKERECENL